MVSKPCRRYGNIAGRTKNRECLCEPCVLFRNKRSADRRRTRRAVDDVYRKAQAKDSYERLMRKVSENPDFFKERYAKDVRENKLPSREQKLLYGAKRRAKKLGVPFSLTIEDIVIPDKCPILGIPLVSGEGKLQDSSPSLDRRYDQLGYVKENVHVISYKANRMKNNATDEEIALLAKWISSTKRQFGSGI